MSKKVLNKRLDLTGNSVLRVAGQQLLARCIPLGNYRGGAGFKCLVIFVVLHYAGKPLFHVLIRFERQLHSLYRLRESIRNKGRNSEVL